MDYSAEQINKAFEKLPKILTEAILETNIDEIELNITNKYKIHLDTATILSNYIIFTLIGLMKAEDFGPNVMKDLGLPEEDSQKIIKDINNLIFKVVRENMKNIQKKDTLLQEAKALSTTETKVPLPPYAQDSIKEDLGVLKDSGVDIIEEKLNTSTKSDNKISDYSIPKINSRKERVDDPYREEI